MISFLLFTGEYQLIIRRSVMPYLCAPHVNMHCTLGQYFKEIYF